MNSGILAFGTDDKLHSDRFIEQYLQNLHAGGYPRLIGYDIDRMLRVKHTISKESHRDFRFPILVNIYVCVCVCVCVCV